MTSKPRTFDEWFARVFDGELLAVISPRALAQMAYERGRTDAILDASDALSEDPFTGGDSVDRNPEPVAPTQPT